MSGATTAVDEAIARARAFESAGDLEEAAVTLAAVGPLDRARVLRVLVPLLERLAVDEDGLRYRFVPGGTFRQGSDVGEPDERPAHDVTVRSFWMTETPVSWHQAWALLGWGEPPAMPEQAQLQAAGLDPRGWDVHEDGKIRRQYCESHTQRARDWHAHMPDERWSDGSTSRELFGEVLRDRPEAPWRYNEKPMVAVDWGFAQLVASRAKPPPGFAVRLPTESEWERAARGLFAGAEYPWGDAPPDGTRADYGRFSSFSIQPSHAFAPNDFGLFAMAGGVWEWCEDDYDACFYEGSPARDPLCRVPSEVVAGVRKHWRTQSPMVSHVVRGGSWADEASALRVSFRSALDNGSTPNVGVRLVRARR